MSEPKKRGRKLGTGMTDTQRRAVGRPAKRRDLDKVPGLSVPTSLPEPPDQLDAFALVEWERVGKFLSFTRRVSELDRQSLAAYCVSWVAYGNAIRPLLIGRQSLWGFVNGKPRPSKLEEVARNHAAIVIETARRFGMTARTRHLDHADTGRPALPDELHELRGNPSKKHLKTPLAEWTVGGWSEDDIAMPGWFDRTAMEEWQRLTTAYHAINMFTPLDYSVLAVACATWSLYLKATDQCNEQGLIAHTDKGAAVEHPLSQIMRRQLDILKEVWIDYGMTPLDRRRFKHSGGSTEGEQKKRYKVYLGEG
jgi:P27 family predicted phage terminase small subunit